MVTRIPQKITEIQSTALLWLGSAVCPAYAARRFEKVISSGEESPLLRCCAVLELRDIQQQNLGCD